LVLFRAFRYDAGCQVSQSIASWRFSPAAVRTIVAITVSARARDINIPAPVPVKTVDTIRLEQRYSHLAQRHY